MGEAGTRHGGDAQTPLPGSSRKRFDSSGCMGGAIKAGAVRARTAASENSREKAPAGLAWKKRKGRQRDGERVSPAHRGAQGTGSFADLTGGLESFPELTEKEGNVEGEKGVSKAPLSRLSKRCASSWKKKKASRLRPHGDGSAKQVRLIQLLADKSSGAGKRWGCTPGRGPVRTCKNERSQFRKSCADGEKKRTAHQGRTRRAA